MAIIKSEFKTKDLSVSVFGTEVKCLAEECKVLSYDKTFELSVHVTVYIKGASGLIEAAERVVKHVEGCKPIIFENGNKAMLDAYDNA